MTCEESRDALFGYHFATLDGDERTAVERHLLECRSCVAELIALKRAIETAEHETPASNDAKARLRRAVAEELGLAVAVRPARARWERPVAFGFAATAVVCAVLTAYAVATGPAHLPRAPQEATAIESH
jgi:hypothetical protein